MACDDSERHQDLRNSSELINKEGYLGDSNKNELNEISGFLIQNANSGAGRYGNGRGGSGQDGYPLPRQEDSFGKRPKGVPYFESRTEKLIFWVDFDLSLTTKTKGFSYGNTLNTRYSNKCGGGTSRSCSYFELKKSELTSLVPNPLKEGEKICLTSQQSSGNKGEKKEDCQSK